MLAAVHVLAVQQADDLGVLDEDAEGVAHQPFHRRHRVQAAHLDVAVVGAHHAVDVLHHGNEHLLLAPKYWYARLTFTSAALTMRSMRAPS